MGIYDYSATTLSGEEKSLSEFQGKVLLIVNTASKCGFTPQYKGLESLYETLQPKGLEILGFPCNQFGKQEPGAADEIGAFCEKNYGVIAGQGQPWSGFRTRLKRYYKTPKLLLMSNSIISGYLCGCWRSTMSATIALEPRVLVRLSQDFDTIPRVDRGGVTN